MSEIEGPAMSVKLPGYIALRLEKTGFLSDLSRIAQNAYDALNMLNNNEPRGAFNKLFFGDENKTYFASAEEAAPYMRDVTVNVWQLQPDGTKTQAALKLTVHKYLAADVYEIFQRILRTRRNSPSPPSADCAARIPCATPGARRSISIPTRTARRTAWTGR